MEDSNIKGEFGTKVGKRIRAVRIQGGIKQKDLAAAIGIHKVQFSRYERGVNVPGLETLKKIADYVGVPAESLYDIETLREETAGYAPQEPPSEKWEKVRQELKGREIPDEFIDRLEAALSPIFFEIGKEEYNKGYAQGMTSGCKLTKACRVLSEEVNDLLNAAIEVLESDDDVIRDALIHNIRAFSDRLKRPDRS